MGGPSGELLAALQTSVSDVAGSFRIERMTPVAGGCIHRCLLLEGGGRRYFAKTNARSEFDNFAAEADGLAALSDRKSTRLNSSHGYISYAVFCLKKKKKKQVRTSMTT